MSFLNPYAFLFLISIPLFIILKLLHKKPKSHFVGFIKLWKGTKNISEKERPKFKKKFALALFLQAIALLSLTIAIAQPYIYTNSYRSRYISILVDNSASTNPFFSTIKKDIQNFIQENCTEADKITFFPTVIPSALLIPHNISPDSALKILEHIPSTEAIDNALSILKTAMFFVKQYPSPFIAVFSDKSFDIPSDIPLRYFTYDPSLNNIALLNMNISPMLQKGEYGFFILIKNFSQQRINLKLTVEGISLPNLQDLILLKSSEIILSPDEEKGINLNIIIPANIDLIKIQIYPHRFKDDLNADNVLWIKKISKHIVYEGNPSKWLKKVFSLFHGITFTKNKKEFSVVNVFINHLPSTLPQSNLIIIDPPPNSKTNLFTTYEQIEIENQRELEFNYDSSLMKMVNMKEISFKTIRKIKILEKFKNHFYPIISYKNYPLIGEFIFKNRRILIITFPLDISFTNWITHASGSFPTFFFNVIKEYVGCDIELLKNGFFYLKTGEVYNTPFKEGYYVKKYSLYGKGKYNSDEMFVAYETGLYELTAGKKKEYIPVNLLSEKESSEARGVKRSKNRHPETLPLIYDNLSQSLWNYFCIIGIVLLLLGFFMEIWGLKI